MVPEAPFADTKKFVSNGEWQFIGFPAKRNVIYYVCCPEPYPDVTFTLQIQRLALFYYMNLIIPCLLITGEEMALSCVASRQGDFSACKVDLKCLFKVLRSRCEAAWCIEVKLIALTTINI